MILVLFGCKVNVRKLKVVMAYCDFLFLRQLMGLIVTMKNIKK